jgi:hypothetical protein
VSGRRSLPAAAHAISTQPEPWAHAQQQAFLPAAAPTSIHACTVLPSLPRLLPSPGLTVYHLHIEQLRQLRPDVVLTCLQTAHGAVLSDGLLDAALHNVLGYAPRVVHCAAADLAGVWRDMQASGQAVPGQRRGLPAGSVCPWQRQLCPASCHSVCNAYQRVPPGLPGRLYLSACRRWRRGLGQQTRGAS